MKTIQSYLPWLLACWGLAMIPACSKESDIEASLSAIKNNQWREQIGQTVEVEGYLIIHDDGTAMLVADPKDVSTNGLIPEERYLLLGSENLRMLDREAYYMDHVRIRGVVRETQDNDRRKVSSMFGDLSLCEVEATEPPTVVTQWNDFVPVFLNPCETHPALCNLTLPVAGEKYALLYSGGINKDKAYMRYWNDLSLYYNMLVWQFGYDPDNIVVVYKNGVAEDNSMPVHYAANLDGVATAFNYLRDVMGFNDQFFLFMTNHGGTWTDVGSPDPTDEEPAGDQVDETTFYYNEAVGIFDEQFVSWVNNLRFARMTCVMEQCFSGGFIYDLRGNNRVIVSAANEIEVSYGGAKYDEFAMLFAAALVGFHLETGAAVDADTDNNGKVSILEAFLYAKGADPHPEHPQFEDNGDGIPVGTPNTGGTIDGAYGATIYF
jgi:hypothetical protein